MTTTTAYGGSDQELLDAVAWVGAAAIGLRLAAGTNPGGPLVERFVAFRPSGQVAWAAFTVVAAIIVALRRDALEIGRTV